MPRRRKRRRVRKIYNPRTKRYYKAVVLRNGRYKILGLWRGRKRR